MEPSIDVEARTQQLGRALLDEAAEYRPGPAERVEDWLLIHAVSDQRFRGRLLRYLDVLSALDYDTSGREAKRLAREYFGGAFPELPRALRWLLRLARNEAVPARLVGESAQRSAELFARRFITPPGEDTVRTTTASLARLGRVPSFDLLGEAVLSDAEADAYVESYLALIAQLARDPSAGARTGGGNAALQVSVKLSSLAAHFSPADFEGSIARVRPGLEAIAQAAGGAGVGVTVDMEQYELRDLAWEVFRRTFARGESLGSWPDAGIVLQGYLRDSGRQGEALLHFAAARGEPFQLRMAKGAYWDYETIIASAARWPSPVFTEKSATDANFEALTERLVGAPGLRLAIASHNARAHAFAEAVAEAKGLPRGAIEHQTLYRTAEGTSRALASMGWVTRDYVPVGELLPGMAYLVRRVLENASQAGFLLQSRSGASGDELLRPPRRSAAPNGADAAPDTASFQRAAGARWHDPAFRHAFEAALGVTRDRRGERFELRAGDETLPAQRFVEVRSPSHPSAPPIGTVAFAGLDATARGIEVATAASAWWAARPPSERASVLRRAADLIAERELELAAWVVHEGGRDRADAFAEVEEAIDYLRYYSAEAERLFDRFGAVITPRGVVAVIPPWNFPLAIPCGMTAAALAAGNTVILKPAEQTPLIALRLVATLHEAGVPREALVCLPGDGEVVGDALARDPRVSMVAFTGSRAVGERLHEVVSTIETASGDLKALVAEMGGKNAIVVFADADPDEAIDGILRSAFGHANQKCSAASRVLIQTPILDRLRARLVEAAASLRVGAGDDPATQVNPVIDAEARTRLEAAAARARREGEVLLDGFEVRGASALEVGPLIVQQSPEGARTSVTATEELFGPILTLVPFETEAEAYELANATAYGLTAGVYSRSPLTIERACRAIEAGNIYVNRPITGARVGIEPFGGVKMSGTGPKAGGPDYLWAFVRRTDAVSLNDRPRAVEDSTSPFGVSGVAARWDAPIDGRIVTIEAAAVRLGQTDSSLAAEIYAVTQAARRELAAAQPVVAVAGQHTELRYDLPRGIGVIDARGPGAAWHIAAALAAGNACVVFDRSVEGDRAVAALHRAGVPVDVLRAVSGGVEGALAAAAAPQVAFLATSDGGRFALDACRALGPTLPGQRALKALISPLDGPQPGEPGFAGRFANPRVVAIRTLRHGAELSLDA